MTLAQRDEACPTGGGQLNPLGKAAPRVSEKRFRVWWNGTEAPTFLRLPQIRCGGRCQNPQEDALSFIFVLFVPEKLFDDGENGAQRE